jgi:exodeoxyribonuclease III
MNPIRVVTWNCNGAFRRKANNILVAEPDIAVIQECEKNHGLPFQNLWFGDNKNRGIAVFASSDYKLTLHPFYNPEFRHVIPIIVSGRDDFNLMAVWAMNDEINHEKRYIAQVWQALKYYRLDKPIMIVGDFNWNKIWDKNPSYPLLGNWANTMKLLRSKGITSVYHRCGNVKFGKEERNTYFRHKDINQGYHTDYCFASKEFEVEKVGITDPERWLKLSDHMAVIVDFE